jgi:uncharacterized protein (TIGR01627 family)
MKESEALIKVKEFKSQGKGLMTSQQYEAIAKLLVSMSPCNFLVFGLGDDSYLWQDINSEGKNVFLENDEQWMQKFSKSSLDIRKVEYTTKIKDVNIIQFDENLLKLDLEEDIRSTDWDLILVDAPLGHGPPNPNSPWKNTPGRPFKGPGRMSSIYEASKLIGESGYIIVDDLSRHVEAVYAGHFIGQDKMINLIENKVGIFKLQ